MTVLASDDFNRADAPTLGANWTLRLGNDYTVASNKAVFTTATPDSSMFYNAVSFPNDQYCQAVLAGLSGTTDQAGLGVCVRCDISAAGAGPTAVNFYGLVVNTAATNNVSLEKYVSNTYSLLGQRTQAWTDGDIIRLEVQGTTLRMYRNGVQLGASVTDTSLASGAGGLYHAASFSGGTTDNWEAGSLTLPGPGDDPPIGILGRGAGW